MLKLHRLKRWKWWAPAVWILDHIIPKKENRVIFISTPDFSDNSKVFYDYLRENSNYELIWLWRKTEIADVPCVHFDSLKAGWLLITAKYIVSTHVTPIFTKGIVPSRHKLMAVWHGMPLKTLGLNEKNIDEHMLKLYRSYSHGHFFVSSDVFGLSMQSCFRADHHRIHITGQPRTDLIFSKKKSLEKMLGRTTGKVVLYTPTWKENVLRTNREITTEYSNMFYLDDYDEKIFKDFLEKNNITFILKPHPFDEKFYLDNFDLFDSRVKLLTTDDFMKHDINFYEVFNETTMMISDFSSIVVDYAITQKPILIIDTLTSDYAANRGFLLKDNFHRLTPGIRVKSFSDLLEQIQSSLYQDECSYKDMLPLLHKHLDGNACKRIVELMKQL